MPRPRAPISYPGVTQVGPNKWRIVVNLPGTRQHRSRKVETFYGTQEQAILRKAELLASRDAGVRIDAARWTVAEFLQRWQDELGPTWEPSTRKTWSIYLRLHVVPAIGAFKLGKIQTPHIQRMVNALYTERTVSGRKWKPLAPNTISSILRMVASAFSYAVECRYIVFNPAKGVRLPEAEPVEPDVFSPEGVAAVLDMARRTPDYAAIFTLFWTGMRRGEVLSLLWERVDLERGTIKVRKGKRGTNAHRTITLEPEHVAVLREHRAAQNEMRLKLGRSWQDHGLVFPQWNGAPMSGQMFYSRFKVICRKAGYPEAHPHTARHTHATAALEEGVETKYVSDRLGHSNTTITQNTYMHVRQSKERIAAEAWSKWMGQQRQEEMG